MASKEATHGIEMGLRYRAPVADGGAIVVVPIDNSTAPELRIKAEEMNLKRGDAEASAVFRHVIYEDWQPITKITAVPHPTIPFAKTFQVS